MPDGGLLFTRVVFIHEIRIVLAKTEVVEYCRLIGRYGKTFTPRTARIASMGPDVLVIRLASSAPCEMHSKTWFPENTGRIQSTAVMARGQPESLFGTACDTTKFVHLFQFGKKGATSGIASRAYPSGARIKKAGLGPARDRRTVLEFQFLE